MSVIGVTPFSGSAQIAGVYATPWRYRRPKVENFSPFEPTRFAAYTGIFPEQLERLPRLITTMRPVTVGVERRPTEAPAQSVFTGPGEIYLFALPSDQIVATLFFACQPDTYESLDTVLDEFTDDHVTITPAGESTSQDLVPYLKSVCAGLARVEGGQQVQEVGNFLDEYEEIEQSETRWRTFLVALHLSRPRKKTVRQRVTTLQEKIPQRHELICLTDPINDTWVENLLYRRQEKHSREFTRRKFVNLDDGELPGNARVEDQAALRQAGRPGSRLIVTTLCSIIQGHKELVETSALLSVVQAVGTLARFRSIWDGAYKVVRTFRDDKQRQNVGEQQRGDLELLADELGNLEFDLTFSVEFPLMRVEAVHQGLMDVLDLKEQAERLRRMFTQLSGSVQSEITAIDIRESQETEIRHQRNDLATFWLSFIGVPLGALLAFFGVSTGEADNSMLDLWHYRFVYAAAIVLAVVPAFVLWATKRYARRKVARLVRQRALSHRGELTRVEALPRVPGARRGEPERVRAEVSGGGPARG